METAMLLTALLSLTIAQTEAAPQEVQSILFLEIIARRAPQCELLEDWQSAAIRTQTAQALRGYDIASQDLFETEIAARVPGVACDDPQMIAWIAGVEPGIAREFLPQFLVAYRAFARLETPPVIFTSEAEADPDRALSRIDAEIARLADAGITPEGGGDWATHQARVDAAALSIADILETGESDGMPPADAAILVRDAVTVTELWLAAHE
jgi:hypothetical protein